MAPEPRLPCRGPSRTKTLQYSFPPKCRRGCHRVWLMPSWVPPRLVNRRRPAAQEPTQRLATVRQRVPPQPAASGNHGQTLRTTRAQSVSTSRAARRMQETAWQSNLRNAILERGAQRDLPQTSTVLTWPTQFPNVDHHGTQDAAGASAHAFGPTCHPRPRRGRAEAAPRSRRGRACRGVGGEFPDPSLLLPWLCSCLRVPARLLGLATSRTWSDANRSVGSVGR